MDECTHTVRGTLFDAAPPLEIPPTRTPAASSGAWPACLRHALTICLCLFGAPAQAQTLPASLRPCVATHFDAALYQQALESWGWVLIPALSRAAQAEDLAETFAGVSVPADGTTDAQLRAAKVFWREQVKEALVFDAQGQTLFLVAGLDGEGRNTVRCFASLPTGTLSRAFETANAREPDGVRGTAWRHFTTRNDNFGPGQTLAVTFVQSNLSGTDPGPDGFATVLTVATVPPACPDGSFDEAIEALRTAGWALASAEDTDAAEHLAWTLMIPYLETDRGGEDVSTLLGLQRIAVPGLFRKADTDATRTRVLRRPDGAMTVTQITDPLGVATRTCRIARTAPPPSDGPSFAAPGAPQTLIERVITLPQEVSQ